MNAANTMIPRWAPVAEEYFRVKRRIGERQEYGLQQYETVGNAQAETPEEAVYTALEEFDIESETDLAQLIEDDQQPVKTQFIAEPLPDQYEVTAYWDGDAQEMVIQEGRRLPNDDPSDE